jgi:hypothetical protein
MRQADSHSFISGNRGTSSGVKNILRVTASTVVISAGLGLAGLGAAAVAEAQPAPFAPFPDYHWCPGQWWDPGWGRNWDFGRCHDDHWFDGDPRDQGHWHGY